MQTSLTIQATNVHQGGGKALLDALIKALPLNRVTLLLDRRMPIPEALHLNCKVIRFRPTIFQRLKAELWLTRNTKHGDCVICFGNLPPFFKLRSYSVVFLQNRYLIDNVRLLGFPFKVRIRLAIERMWLSFRMANVDAFVVQTPSMKRLLEKKIRGKVPVRCLPFVADPQGYERTSIEKKARTVEFDFIYVASGEPHKNHNVLIEAWCLLAMDGVFPSLCLTLEEGRFQCLCHELEGKNKRYGLNLLNLGLLSHEEVLAYYSRSGALIYPSTFEAFGLPLIEAKQAGLPVLAAELDFVRDVLDPVQTFDPYSPISIARAVKRHMGIEEAGLDLRGAEDFINTILSDLS